MSDASPSTSTSTAAAANDAKKASVEARAPFWTVILPLCGFALLISLVLGVRSQARSTASLTSPESIAFARHFIERIGAPPGESPPALERLESATCDGLPLYFTAYRPPGERATRLWLYSYDPAISAFTRIGESIGHSYRLAEGELTATNCPRIEAADSSGARLSELSLDTAERRYLRARRVVDGIGKNP